MEIYPEVAYRLARGNPESSGLHVYYDLDENIPYFKRKYAGPNAVDVCSLSRWWCDPRPPTRQDLSLLREGVEESLGPGSWRQLVRLLERGVVLVNTDEAGVADQIWEFIVNGVRLGTLYYDIVSRRARFIPGPLAATVYVLEGLLEPRRIPRVERGAIIDAGSSLQLVFDGARFGVAVRLRGSSLSIVLDEWSVEEVRLAESALTAQPRTELEVYEANLEHIESLVEKARRAVEWLEGRLGRRGVLGFSGGKDSLLALHLLVEAGSNLIAFYSHIEHGDPSHIPRFVERTTSKLGVELVMHVNEWKRVERMLEAHGMPVRGYRWCTQVFKISPLMNFLKMLGRERIVSYTGSRSYETLRRGLKPATYVDVEHGILAHAVPYKWPRYLEMLALRYRFRAELPIDYELGFERISCVTCPNKSVYELHLSEQLYRGDWEPWEKYILEAVENVAVEGVEVARRVHAWRLPLQPHELRAVAAVAGFKPRLRLPGPRRPWRKADSERVSRLTPILLPGARVYDNRVEDGECRARLDERRGVWLEEGRFGACSRILKTLYALAYCTSCGACIPRCPYDAIIGMPIEVDAERCRGRECLACVETCPLAWGAIDMALANLYLGYRRALDRLRRLREEKGRVFVEKAKRIEEEVYRTKREGRVEGVEEPRGEAGGDSREARG